MKTDRAQAPVDYVVMFDGTEQRPMGRYFSSPSGSTARPIDETPIAELRRRDQAEARGQDILSRGDGRWGRAARAFGLGSRGGRTGC